MLELFIYLGVSLLLFGYAIPEVDLEFAGAIELALCGIVLCRRALLWLKRRSD